MPISSHLPDVLKIAALTSSFKFEHFSFQSENKTMYLVDAPIISIFAKKFANKIKVLITPDGQFGMPSTGGNWTGMIGMLKREEADIAIGKVFLSEERLSIADFYPYQYIPITFITDQPKQVRDKFGILHPFQPLLWLVVAAMLMLVMLICKFITIKRYSFVSVVFQIYGSLLEKSINFKLNRVSSKVLIVLWVIGAMFITFSYKAVLLSFLTFPTLAGISTIAELAKASENVLFKCAAYAGTSVYTEVLDEGDESWRMISSCINRTDIHTKNFGTFLQPSSYQKAFLAPKPLLKSLHRNYFISDDSFYTQFICVAVRKSFCCKDELHKFLHRLVDAGIIHKLAKDDEFFYAYGKHSLEIEENNLKLSLEDFALSFMILLMGYILSCAVFTVEILVSRKRKQNNDGGRIYLCLRNQRLNR